MENWKYLILFLKNNRWKAHSSTPCELWSNRKRKATTVFRCCLPVVPLFSYPTTFLTTAGHNVIVKLELAWNSYPTLGRRMLPVPYSSAAACPQSELHKSWIHMLLWCSVVLSVCSTFYHNLTGRIFSTVLYNRLDRLQLCPELYLNFTRSPRQQTNWLTACLANRTWIIFMVGGCFI